MTEVVKGTKADTMWVGAKVPSIRDLKLKPRASQAYQRLIESVIGEGSNCGGRFEEYAGRDEDLPSDKKAQLMCVGCPSFERCNEFLRDGHPAYGVWAGQVRRLGNDG